MRLLRLTIEGAELYQDARLSLDLYATDRVVHRVGEPLEDVFCVDERTAIYSQNIVGLTGVNASGKTTTLNLLKFALAQLTGTFTMRGFGMPVGGLGKLADDLRITAVFWHGGSFYLIDSHLRRDCPQAGPSDPDTFESLSFSDETVWRLNVASRVTRALIADRDEFIERSTVAFRRGVVPGAPGHISEDVEAVLGRKRSIAALVTNRMPVAIEAPERELPAVTMPTEVIRAFDSSIEYLKWDAESQVFHLKFEGEDDRTVGMGAAVSMLSRGTVNGADLVDHAVDVLSKGGYLIVDELEKSLNRSLASMVLDLFSSPITNPKGAQMVFTTHYPELLDGLARKDCVYVLVRDDSHRTEVVKYSDRISRVENKKSEVILSNLIHGSMPRYADVQALREYVRQHVNG